MGRQNAPICLVSGRQRAPESASLETNIASVQLRATHTRAKNPQTAIAETGKQLVLDDALIAKLSKDELTLQLNYHRDAEKGILASIPKDEQVPAKSKLKNNELRRVALLAAAARYRARQQPVTPSAIPQAPQSGPSRFDTQYEFDYYDNNH